MRNKIYDTAGRLLNDADQVLKFGREKSGEIVEALEKTAGRVLASSSTLTRISSEIINYRDRELKRKQQKSSRNG